MKGRTKEKTKKIEFSVLKVKPCLSWRPFHSPFVPASTILLYNCSHFTFFITIIYFNVSLPKEKTEKA